MRISEKMETITSAFLHVGKITLLMGTGAGLTLFVYNMDHLNQTSKGIELLDNTGGLMVGYTLCSSLYSGVKLITYDLFFHKPGDTDTLLIDPEKLIFNYLKENDGTVHCAFSLPFGATVTISKKGKYNINF